MDRTLDAPALALAVPTNNTTDDSLLALAAGIRQAVAHAEDAYHSWLESARQAGELLIEAKEQVAHGEWLPWLMEYCDLSFRVAQNYMRLARHWDQIANANQDSYLTMTEALALLRKDEDDPQADDAGNKTADAGHDLELAPGGLAVDAMPEVVAPAMTPPSAYPRPVQLFFDGTEHADFAPLVEDLKAAFHTTDIETTVARAVQYAHRELCSKESLAC